MGNPVLSEGTWTLPNGSMLLSTEPPTLGSRVAFDAITDKSGKQPWEQLRVLLDYVDENNHAVLLLTSFSAAQVTLVRDGKRENFYSAKGRGKPGDWHLFRLEFLEDGVRVDLDLRGETTIPYLRPGQPGRIGFAAQGGASGRVSNLTVTPLPSMNPALSLHPLISDHAVLPREINFPIWGRARPGASVEVLIDKKSVGKTTTGEDSEWLVEIPPQEPGGPHTITIRSGNAEIGLSDILFGDVWFCSGQSNMFWRLRDIDDAEAEIAAADKYRTLRIFPVQVEGSDKPQAVPPTPSEWFPSTPGIARHVSAIAQIFGREISTELGIPVGVIVSAKGGSRIEAWMSEDTRRLVEKEIGPYDEPYRKKLAEHDNPPGSLFNAMVVPYVNFPVKGFLWYQGEANGWRGWHYEHQLTAMINDWRARFPGETEPFLIVQLAAWAGKNMDPNAAIWTDLREAQWNLSRKMDAVHTAVTIDLGDKEEIHPRKKRPVAERLAKLALHYTYGRKDIVADPPQPIKFTPIDGGVRVTFDRPVTLEPGGESDFQIASGTAAFKNATAVSLHSPTELDILGTAPGGEKPATVRYAWRNYARAPLKGPEGLAVAPFRTDTCRRVSDGLF
ncbi:MAG: hypothetical protein Fur0032_23120 [Terrimicrobiaceae bacterium]